ncbi:hypothetical protein HDU97_002687 [Phlyctochytrium planicorne]|nr:hypothetical protein HDU97_002687 [Phlyctochytrium planicorne]
MTTSNSINHELLTQIKAILLSDPAFMTSIQDFVRPGIFSPSNAKFNPDGTYILPSTIPPTHKLDAPIERLEILAPHVPAYRSLVKRLSDLKAYQEEATAKLVADLETSILSDQTKIKDLDDLLIMEEKELLRLQGVNFKSVKAKILGKQAINSSRTQDSVVTMKTERSRIEQGLRESTAKLEKARIALQLSNSDSAAFAVVQKDLTNLLNQTFNAALDLTRKIHEKLLSTHKSITAFKKANPHENNNFCYLSEQEILVSKRFNMLKEAEATYKEIRKDAEILIKIVPDLESRLPEFRLMVPDLILEHAFANYTYKGEYDSRFNTFQVFAIDKNHLICQNDLDKVQKAFSWLKDSLESITVHRAMVKSDLDMKETELNIFRMGCFEVAAEWHSGRAKLDKFGMMKLLA